eukprot:TRINITY_DN114674_c0_g1_i1.p1 TRINITY_DN114674_c0_g1~~TRINITY_DN114674_c0_g1_i1.p1  ORF type:complete len:356 (-),score=59.27 TRINITY_DN114674_c0_g1_i1:21-1040(-)
MAGGHLCSDMPQTSKELRKEDATSEQIKAPPKALQEQAVVRYDASRIQFLEAIRLILEKPEDCDLSKLHKLARSKQAMAEKKRIGTAEMGNVGHPWRQKFHGCKQDRPGIFQKFTEAYHDFLRYVVLDDLRTDVLAFQVTPTFRCHMPYCGNVGRPHRDEDYHHPVCEVNYWVPVTTCFGSNSLYSESRRGLGDFKAFEASLGESIRFYGNQVWHYCVPNETDSTRVSFDFRVSRIEEWSPAAFSYFSLGGFYAVMSRSGLIPQESEAMQDLKKKYGVAARPQRCQDHPSGTRCAVSSGGAGDLSESTSAAASVGSQHDELSTLIRYFRLSKLRLSRGA